MGGDHRMRLADKVIGPVMRRLIRRAGELGIIDVRGRVFLAVLALTVAFNRIEDTVDLQQVMYYAGLCEGQGGRDNKHGRRMAREALHELGDVGLVDILPPDVRWGRWHLAVPDWTLGVPVDNPAGNPVDIAVDNTAVQIEGGQSPPLRGAISPLQGGQSPPYYVPSSSEGKPRRGRAREPVQLQLHLVWIRELTGTGLDVDDPVCQLLAELDEDTHQTLADLARAEYAHPDLADQLDQADLADWIPEILHELYPDRIPPPAGIAALNTLNGPRARHVLTIAMPRAADALAAQSRGLIQLHPDRPDDPRIASTLDAVIDDLRTHPKAS